jgi:hypothetical protein
MERPYTYNCLNVQLFTNYHRMCNKSKNDGYQSGAGTVHSSRISEFAPGFQ